MDFIMTGSSLAARCLDIAQRYKTIYMYACYGFQVTDATIRAKAQQNLNGWYTEKNIKKLKAAANQQPPVWGFDCVNLIKGILWGWTGDESKEKGGAKYATNGIPDTNADGMIGRCTDVSEDFYQIEIGEAVWMKGHIGVYIGDGMAVECTPKWADGVQVTAVLNRGKVEGLNGRTWTKHGKIPHVAYGEGEITEEAPVYALGRRILKRGSSGEDVAELQRALLSLGFPCGNAGIDGEFGRDTEKAVMLFQAKHGLLGDGIFGPMTLEALKAALDQEETEGLPDPDDTFTVVIRGASRADADLLKYQFPDAEVTQE